MTTKQMLFSFLPYIVNFIITAGTMILGYIIYRWQTKDQVNTARDQADIQTKAMADQASIQAAQSPITVLTAAVTARDQELARVRESHEQLIQDLVKDFKQSFKDVSSTLIAIQQGCQTHCQIERDIQAALAEHARDSTKGRGILHARMNTLQYMIATGGKNPPPEEPVS